MCLGVVDLDLAVQNFHASGRIRKEVASNRWCNLCPGFILQACADRTFGPTVACRRRQATTKIANAGLQTPPLSADLWKLRKMAALSEGASVTYKNSC